MFLDIITAAILVICAARGVIKGIRICFFNALGWIGAFIASIFLTRPLASFYLKDGSERLSAIYYLQGLIRLSGPLIM